MYIKQLDQEQQSVRLSETLKLNIPQVEYSTQNMNCLSEAIFHEAGIESSSGKEAVGLVIINRANQRKTSNLCSVIYESAIVNGQRICQFSYHCLNKIKNPNKGINWAKSVLVAASLLNSQCDRKTLALVGTATFYHADYVLPSWSKKLQFLGKIDTHLFYKEEEKTI